uniref:Uncharacterized protein n=1 Tax=Glossina pallidipes TaxID=7398 RepID=A0A1A9ZAJ8_GLOPL
MPSSSLDSQLSNHEFSAYRSYMDESSDKRHAKRNISSANRKVPSQCKRNAIVKEKINPIFLLSQVFFNASGRFSSFHLAAIKAKRRKFANYRNNFFDSFFWGEKEGNRIIIFEQLMRHMCTINTCYCGGICESMKQRMNECLEVTVILCAMYAIRYCYKTSKAAPSQLENVVNDGGGGSGVAGILLHDNYDNDCVLN